MMSLFGFATPKAKPVSFHKAMAGGIFTKTKVSDATKENLKGISAVSEKVAANLPVAEAAHMVPLLDEYLPYLFALRESLRMQPELKASLRLTWTSSVGVPSAKLYTFDHINFELVMAMTALAASLCNNAVHTLYGCRDDDRLFPEASKPAALALRRAAGIFERLATDELPLFTNLPHERPPEIIIPVARALADLATAQAQELAIRNGAIQQMSPQVLAKLCVFVYKTYDEIEGSLQSAKADWKDLSLALKGIVAVKQAFYRAVALKFLAEGAYQGEQWGKSIGMLQVARVQLDAITVPGGSGSPLMTRLKEQLEAERKIISEIEERRKKENGLVYFDKIPDRGEIEACLPEGRKLMAPIRFEVPPLPFERLETA